MKEFERLIKLADGDKFWYFNDELHREDGPAIEEADGTKHWYYHGKRLDCSSQMEFERIIKLRAFW